MKIGDYSKLLGLDRQCRTPEFSPLSSTKPPLNRKWLHDCHDCVWRGSIEHTDHVDFYIHDNKESLMGSSYIGRNGDEPFQYVSMSKSCLLIMANELDYIDNCDWVLRLLCELAIFDDLPIGSAEYGFKLRSVSNEVRVLLNPFLEERRVYYIEDAVKNIANKYLGWAMEDGLLCSFSNEICKLIQYQISIGR